MTDFEDRLSTALRSVGDDAPDAVGLAPAARDRARARTRRTALTSVGVAVAVAGLAFGVAALAGPDDVTVPAADDPTPTVSSSPDTPVSNTRVESWRDLSVTVPADWGHGSLDDWCGNGGELGAPVVQRPEGASIDILCDPENGYGVQFFDGAAISLAYEPGHIWQYEKGDVEMYPDGSWLGFERGAGDNLVWVVAPDRATVEEILGTFEQNRGADANGCSAHAGDTVPAVAEGSVRLCRYAIDGWLEQSELLSGQEATDAVVALEAAPARDPDRMCTMEISGPTVQITSADAEGSLTLNACQGFTWDGVTHELSADAIYWALSPGWSGGVEGDVPMPEQPRTVPSTRRS